MCGGTERERRCLFPFPVLICMILVRGVWLCLVGTERSSSRSAAESALTSRFLAEGAKPWQEAEYRRQERRAPQGDACRPESRLRPLLLVPRCIWADAPQRKFLRSSENPDGRPPCHMVTSRCFCSLTTSLRLAFSNLAVKVMGRTEKGKKTNQHTHTELCGQ